MLRYNQFHQRPNLVGISDFNLQKCPFLYKLTRIFSCLPASTNGFALSEIKRSCSLVQIGRKGFSYRNFLSHVMETMGSNMQTEENLHLPSAYGTAMEALSSLITQKRRGDGSPVRSKYNKLERMLMYIKILDLEERIANLKIIHVAGTKGKESTCAFCEANSRECGFRTGLFASPLLIDVREISSRLDISEEKFLHYFWLCCHQLQENVDDELPMPPLFQFLTVLAFKIFACVKVDVAVIEVGLGGTNDSTNVIRDPVVCGVSPLGMDHMETLASSSCIHGATAIRSNGCSSEEGQRTEDTQHFRTFCVYVGRSKDLISHVSII